MVKRKENRWLAAQQGKCAKLKIGSQETPRAEQEKARGKELPVIAEALQALPVASAVLNGEGAAGIVRSSASPSRCVRVLYL